MASHYSFGKALGNSDATHGRARRPSVLARNNPSKAALAQMKRGYTAGYAEGSKVKKQQKKATPKKRAPNPTRPRSKKPKTVPKKVLAAYRRMFGGSISPAAMQLIKKEYTSNPAGAFERCVAQVKKRPGVYSPRGVCATSGRTKYGKAKFQKMAAKGRKKTKRKNPGVDAEAAELYRDFHGEDPDVEIDVVTPIKSHTVLSGLGKLQKLVIRSIDGRHEVTLEGFKGAVLCRPPRKSDKPQLYIEGGDQSVSLKDFGITDPRELEVLGTVRAIVYHTNKTHLRPEDGGRADYDHKFKTGRDENDRHVKIKDGRFPMATYDVRNKLIRLAGGTYTIPAEGISG